MGLEAKSTSSRAAKAARTERETARMAREKAPVRHGRNGPPKESASAARNGEQACETRGMERDEARGSAPARREMIVRLSSELAGRAFKKTGIGCRASSAGWWLVAAAALIGVTGCGGPEPARPSAGGVQAGGSASTQPLPDWAPENPSPEFLRAAKVLRGVPMDAVGRGDMPEESWRALLGYMKQVNPTLWQLFGSLTDAQIESFLSTRKISIPARDLAPNQRDALEMVLDANEGDAVEISGVTLPDFRTLLYKMGAREDLSNVTIGFRVEGGNMVSFNARVDGVEDALEWTGWAQAPRLGSK